ncbi:MAG: hypothetical protein K2P93_08660 [Alphaproteobacteria bacterium]|nr:hypothetical protein [Alphaproteobacteria bacterium]
MKRLFFYVLMTCTATVSVKAGWEDTETSRFDYVDRSVPAKHTFDLTKAKAQLDLDDNELRAFGFSPIAGDPHKYTITHNQLIDLVRVIEGDEEEDLEVKNFVRKEKEKFRSKYGIDLLTSKVGRSNVKVPPITKNYLFNPEDYNADDNLFLSSKLNLAAVRELLARRNLAPDADGDYKIPFQTLRELTNSKNRFLAPADHKFYRICEELEGAFKQKYHTLADYIDSAPKKPIPLVLEFDSSALPADLKNLNQSWFQKNNTKYKIHYSDLLQLIKTFNTSQKNSTTKGLRDAFAKEYGVNLFGLAGIKKPGSEKAPPPPSKPALKPAPKPAIRYAPSIHTFGQAEFGKLDTEDRTLVKSILTQFGVKPNKNGQYHFSHRDLLKAYEIAKKDSQQTHFVGYLKRMLTQIYGYDVLSAPLQPTPSVGKGKPALKTATSKTTQAKKNAVTAKKRGAASKPVKGKVNHNNQNATVAKKRNVAPAKGKSSVAKRVKGNANHHKRNVALAKKRIVAPAKGKNSVSTRVKGNANHHNQNTVLANKRRVAPAKGKGIVAKTIKGKRSVKRNLSAKKTRLPRIVKQRKAR